MYTPHTVTLYNVIQETDLATFEETERVYVTVLRGVFLDATKARNVRQSGLVSADAVDLFIPFAVTAVDPDTGAAKSYLGPQEFWALSHAERATYWTLSVEGNGGETFFVNGEHTYTVVTVPDVAPVGENARDGNTVTAKYLPVNVAMAYDESYTVTKVDSKDFGSESMRHWEVGGA